MSNPKKIWGCYNYPSHNRNILAPLLTEHERKKKEKKKHGLTPEHLITGFGMHSHTSLELAIQAARAPAHYCECIKCDGVEEDQSKSNSTQTSTILDTFNYSQTEAKKNLSYLMGLQGGEEEDTGSDFDAGIIEGINEDEINGGSEAMRRAQRYLREHKIFEFFQFLIAHLLAETPYDPIDFLINLLDKCLVYRAGICEPPLLYNKKHIECLFNLMDRMRTGFIDTSQYKTGMLTFGVKSYNINPPMNDEEMVPKHFFIEEAYECLKDLLNDMIRKRAKEHKKIKKIPKAPPPSMAQMQQDEKSYKMIS